MCIKLVSPQAAQLSMCIFIGKSVVMHLYEGPDYVHTTDRIEKSKKPAPDRIRTHDVSVMRCVLYRCATTAASLNILNKYALNQVLLGGANN